MKNIERFNLYTAYVFGRLYDEFPVHREVIAADVISAMKLPPQDPTGKKGDAATLEAIFVGHTVQWLVETGYLIMRESGSHKKRYVLSPKAFEALNATLSALEGKKPEAMEKSVGERLSEVAAEAGKELVKEGWKQTASEIVGSVIGHAAKAFSSP